MSNDQSHRPAAEGQAWLDVVDDVLDTAIDSDEDLECRFEEVTVDVPLRMDSESEFARWQLDGTVRVHVEGMRGPLSDWLRWWSQQLS
jgi:hypothetical protein